MSKDSNDITSSGGDRRSSSVMKGDPSPDYDLLYKSVTAASNAIMICDTVGRIVWANTAFYNISGYTPEEINGGGIQLLELDSKGVSLHGDVWETVQSGKVWHGEAVFRWKEETHCIIESTITPVFNEDDEITHLICVQNDISEQPELFDRLVQSQRMEGIGLLAGGIVHDFNNLLQIILGCTHLLLCTLDKDDNRYRHALEIDRAANRAAEIINHLITYKRLGAREVQEFNLNDLIREMEGMLERVAGRETRLDFELEQALNYIEADPSRLAQAILNLVIYAQAGVPLGGRILISTKNIPSTEPEPDDQCEPETEGYVSLVVSSTAGDDNEKYSASSSLVGTSQPKTEHGWLGLSIIYGIVKQHRGSIRFDMSPGKEARFEIRLPALQPRTAQPQPPVTTQKESFESAGHILVVEDEAVVRDLATKLLMSGGYQVTSAATYRDALSVFERLDGGVDLVFCDIVLPDGSGIDLVEKLIQRKKSLPVLLTSGYVGDRERDRIIKKRGYKFLAKPYSKDVLLDLVGQLLTSARK